MEVEVRYTECRSHQEEVVAQLLKSTPGEGTAIPNATLPIEDQVEGTDDQNERQALSEVTTESQVAYVDSGNLIERLEPDEQVGGLETTEQEFDVRVKDQGLPDEEICLCSSVTLDDHLMNKSDEESPSSGDGGEEPTAGEDVAQSGNVDLKVTQVEQDEGSFEKKQEEEQKDNNNTSKKEAKKESKKAKKASRDAEHMTRAVMQALSGLETPEEKIAALCKKYAELLGENKVFQREHKVQQKQLSQLQRERDHLQSEHGRAILAKSKLESLCRELQRHNKTIKDESMQRAREEEEKRREVSTKFQQTINEITSQMQDNHTRNLRLKEENLELASKLKKLVEQYERREEHIEKLFKHKELESQLYDAKLQQANLALAEEKERNKREKAILMNESADAQRKCELLSKQEQQLKAQLAVYTEKFEEFQSTLTKSNEIFQTFKVEMDQMTKKIKKLEKETNMWRVRWENSNKSLLNMAEEKTIRDKELADQKNKVVKLEKLCRALQAERNALLGKQRSLEGTDSPKKTANGIPIEQVPPNQDTPKKDNQSENSSQSKEKEDQTKDGDERKENLVNGNAEEHNDEENKKQEETRGAGDGKDEEVEK